MPPPITTADVFDLPHPAPQHRERGKHCRWFVVEFFTSGQGQQMAALRSIDGKHFTTVAVERSVYKVTDGAGIEREQEAPSLFHASNIETGGRAAAQARFDEHEALFQRRHVARKAAAAAQERGDAAAAAQLLAEARDLDAAMKAHCTSNGLALHHV